MQSLRAHVDELFRWHSEPLERKKFAAPYKPFIQSSGTGKTKFLHDFCRRMTEAKAMLCLFISCLPRDALREKKRTYDIYLSDIGSLSNSLNVLLDSLPESEEALPPKVLLVLDEAQLLSDGRSMGIHTLRKFLRHKRDNALVVALIAGTTTCLAPRGKT